MASVTDPSGTKTLESTAKWVTRSLSDGLLRLGRIGLGIRRRAAKPPVLGEEFLGRGCLFELG